MLNQVKLDSVKSIPREQTGEHVETRQSAGYKKTANHFVKNVQRAMRVAEITEGDCPKKMTQESLSTKAGIARSTLANHKELSNSEDKAPNPTLEKICAIAEILNIPPAFLLMRHEDWSKLAQVIEYYSNTRNARPNNPIFKKIASNDPIPPTEQAKLALQLARLLEIINNPTREILNTLSQEEAKDILEKTKKQKISVFTSSSLPPITYMTPDERIAAFAFSVIFGASYKPE